MRCRGPLTAILLAACLVAAACSTPRHTNALIFGTNTKFGVEAGYEPTPGSASILVGYSRQEAVWLPLLANKDNDGNATFMDGQKETGLLFKGTEKDEGLVDTYSVLASFGATVDSGAASTGVKAGTSIAQYFATGIAARKLAEKGGADLVKATTGDVSQEIKDAAKAQLVQWDKNLARITAYVQTSGKVDEKRLADLTANDPVLAESFKAKYAGKDISEFQTALRERYSGKIDDLAANIKE